MRNGHAWCAGSLSQTADLERNGSNVWGAPNGLIKTAQMVIVDISVKIATVNRVINKRLSSFCLSHYQLDKLCALRGISCLSHSKIDVFF